MKLYTTAEVTEAVGDITADAIRKFINNSLLENVDYKKFGRTTMITEAGFKKIKNRKTKPGPQSKTNGRK